MNANDPLSLNIYFVGLQVCNSRFSRLWLIRLPILKSITSYRQLQAYIHPKHLANEYCHLHPFTFTTVFNSHYTNTTGRTSFRFENLGIPYFVGISFYKIDYHLLQFKYVKSRFFNKTPLTRGDRRWFSRNFIIFLIFISQFRSKS